MIRGKDKWSKIITQWYPRDGKRKRGRPQKRWDDDIRQVAGKTWRRVARERLNKDEKLIMAHVNQIAPDGIVKMRNSNLKACTLAQCGSGAVKDDRHQRGDGGRDQRLNVSEARSACFTST
ncbi:hypothetical protein EVAR_63933_1 [Eumeta japonica]|uniref:Uncharacterized protein n=1 Tax=Eumeta variegata TaxID=151549 RepID=A0A4C1ZNK4_EUMVA|nr:hypothetical protein EVAR_63933_1 [Eumeta japonica]